MPGLNRVKKRLLEDQKLGYREEADASFGCFQLPSLLFITNWRLLYLEDAID